MFTMPSAVRNARSVNGYVRKQFIPACSVHSGAPSDKVPRRDKLDLGFNDNIAAFSKTKKFNCSFISSKFIHFRK